MSKVSSKPKWRRWFRAWPIAAVFGVVAGVVGALQVPLASSGADLPPAGDRVQAAVAALHKDPFYVAPEYANRLTATQKATISRTLKGAKEPSYLIYWDSEGQPGYEIDADALDQVMAKMGRNGYYAVVDQRQQATLSTRGLSQPVIDPAVLKQRTGPALEAYAKAMAQLGGRKAQARFDYWGGSGGGFAAGVLFAGGGFLALMLLVWIAGLVVRKR